MHNLGDYPQPVAIIHSFSITLVSSPQQTGAASPADTSLSINFLFYSFPTHEHDPEIPKLNLEEASCSEPRACNLSFSGSEPWPQTLSYLLLKFESLGEANMQWCEKVFVKAGIVGMLQITAVLLN